MMSDINWDLTPEFAAYADVTFFDKNHCEVGNQLDIKRPQTKTVADEQEGEKWTHTYAGDKCFLLEPSKDPDGYYAIKTDCGLFELAKGHELKPIKPKLTKAEAWDKLMERRTNSAEVNTLKQQYDII